jgi:hypothetical protein
MRGGWTIHVLRKHNASCDKQNAMTSRSNARRFITGEVEINTREATFG